MPDKRRRILLHPSLATVPIGCWMASFVFDVASRFVGEPGFLAAGSYWLISVGLIGAIVAGGAGFVDVLPVPSGSGAHRIAIVHVGLAMTAVLLFLVSYIVRAGSAFDQPVSAPLIATAAAGVVVLGAAVATGRSLARDHGGLEVPSRRPSP